MTARTCPDCDRELRADDVFCGGCGVRVPEERPPTCPTCASPAEPGDRFCGECGHELPNAASPPETKKAAKPPKAPKKPTTPKKPKVARQAKAVQKRPAAAAPEAVPARAETSKARRFWPHSILGQAIYVIVILGLAVAPLIEDDDNVMLGLMLGAGAYLILTAWRSLFVAFGFIRGPELA